jgi:transposase-like protein
VAEKRGIVEEMLEPGATVARVAQRHIVNANQVFHWRRLCRKGLLAEKNTGAPRLLPVTVSDVLRNEEVPALRDCQRGVPSGMIQVEFPKGHLRVTGRVDSEALRTSGTVALTPAQLSMLFEGIDWRRPVRSYDPQMAV